jgi:soluble lytic murein transglycosylase-like protein
MGLMQLMPSTANMVKNRMNNEEVAAASDAERNISMGQYYVSHLLKNPI